MNTEEQIKFLNDFDFQQIHPQVQQRHIDFLKSIDKDNQSKAVRLVIDTAINQSRRMIFEKYLLYFIFIVCVIVLISLILPIVS